MKKFLIAQWRYYRQRLALIVTGLFLIAGVVQYAFGLTYVLTLTPIVLAVIAAIALLFWQVSPAKKAGVAAIVIVAGFIIELIGVHTGYLFGDYSYGSVMGYRLWGVPFTIGITWFVVTLSAWHIVSFGGLSLSQRVLLGGVLVVMFDLVLEQFAITFSLWSWGGVRVPIGNYITWFIVGSALMYAYYRVDKKADPSLYIAGLLPLMALFFWLMLIVR